MGVDAMQGESSGRVCVCVRQMPVRAFTGHTHATRATENGLRDTQLIHTVTRKGLLLTHYNIKVIVF